MKSSRPVLSSVALCLALLVCACGDPADFESDALAEDTEAGVATPKAGTVTGLKDDVTFHIRNVGTRDVLGEAIYGLVSLQDDGNVARQGWHFKGTCNGILPVCVGRFHTSRSSNQCLSRGNGTPGLEDVLLISSCSSSRSRLRVSYVGTDEVSGGLKYSIKADNSSNMFVVSRERNQAVLFKPRDVPYGNTNHYIFERVSHPLAGVTTYPTTITFNPLNVNQTLPDQPLVGSVIRDIANTLSSADSTIRSGIEPVLKREVKKASSKFLKVESFEFTSEKYVSLSLVNIPNSKLRITTRLGNINTKIRIDSALSIVEGKIKVFIPRPLVRADYDRRTGIIDNLQIVEFSPDIDVDVDGPFGLNIPVVSSILEDEVSGFVMDAIEDQLATLTEGIEFDTGIVGLADIVPPGLTVGPFDISAFLANALRDQAAAQRNVMVIYDGTISGIRPIYQAQTRVGPTITAYLLPPNSFTPEVSLVAQKRSVLPARPGYPTGPRR